MAEPPKSVDEVIAQAPTSFQPSAAQGLTAVYQYCITGDGGKDYYCDINDGKLEVGEGKHASPSITITVDHQDFLKMLSDPAAGQALFMQGKVKVEPMDMNLIMKMGTLFSAG
jgi:putative sterol carrier protein